MVFARNRRLAATASDSFMGLIRPRNAEFEGNSCGLKVHFKKGLSYSTAIIRIRREPKRTRFSIYPKRNPATTKMILFLTFQALKVKKTVHWRRERVQSTKKKGGVGPGGDHPRPGTGNISNPPLG